MAIAYERVGVGIEDLSMSQNYNVDTKKDVWGETFITTTTGDNTTDVTDIVFNPEYNLAKRIDTAVERDEELSDLDGTFLIVKPYKRIGTDFETGKPLAWKQNASIVPTNFANGNAALLMSASLHWKGAKTFGTYDKDASGDKFTPETEAPAANEVHYKEGEAARKDFNIYYQYEAA